MNEHPQRIHKPIDYEALAEANAVYVSIWNMDCPDCATWLHNGLIQLDSVLRVDVFYEQGVAVIIYVPARTTPTELLKAVKNIGKEVCRFYGADIIGHSQAKQALRLD